MDSFEFNKIAGAVLAAALFAMIIGKVSNAIVHPHMPEKAHIAVTEEVAAAPAPGAAAPTVPPLAPGGDAAAGKVTFEKVCMTCHTAEKGGPNRQGPNLFATAGAKKAHSDSFRGYSSAMQSKGGEWTDDDLNAFLYKPSAFIKGTKMAFAGLNRDKERADVIAYLKSLK